MTLGSAAAATTSFDGTVELGVVLGHSVEHDHQLTQPATDGRHDGLAILAPTIDISNFLLEDFLDRSDLVYILLFDLFTQVGDLLRLLLCFLLSLASQLLSHLVLLSLLLGSSSGLDHVSIGLHGFLVCVVLFLNVVAN